VLWGSALWADNNANRQLGIIQAVRETVRVMKDNLTKVSSDAFDPNLLQADLLFRNDERRLWIPSAESRYREGVQRLNDYVRGLAMRALEREYAQSLVERPILATLFDEVARSLLAAAVMKPLVVLDGSPEGLFANHRRNLDASITEARQKMYTIREELEK